MALPGPTAGTGRRQTLGAQKLNRRFSRGKSMTALPLCADLKALDAAAEAVIQMPDRPLQISESVPPIEEQLIPRQLVRDVVVALQGPSGRSVGLTSAVPHGGIGKSTTAVCVARDPALHGVMVDGAVWVEVGQERSALRVMQALIPRLAALLAEPATADCDEGPDAAAGSDAGSEEGEEGEEGEDGEDGEEGEGGSDSSSSASEDGQHEPLQPGQRVRGKMDAARGGTIWYVGTIRSGDPEEGYAIRYDDGDYEDAVRAKHVVALPPEEDDDDAGDRSPATRHRRLSPLQRATDELRDLLNGRRVLVVVDDVWEEAQAAPIKEVVARAGGSRMLITTRSPDVLKGLGARPFLVELLSSDESTQLMASWAYRDHSSAVDDEETDAGVMRVVLIACGAGEDSAGGLPLLLRYVGVLASEIGWAKALEEMISASEEVELDETYHPLNEQYKSLFGALRVSLETMEPVSRGRYAKLAIFEAHERIPLSVLERFWDTSGMHMKKAVEALGRRSMVLEAKFVDGKPEEGYLRLHSMQRFFLLREANSAIAEHGMALLRASLSAVSRDAKWHAELLRTCGQKEIGCGPLDGPPGGYWAGLAGGHRFSRHLAGADFGARASQYSLKSRDKGVKGKSAASFAARVLGDLAQLTRLNMRQVQLETFPDVISHPALALREISLTGCSSLKAVRLAASITTLGDDSFNGCSALPATTLPEGLVTIGNRAFTDCTGLIRVGLPKSIETIGCFAFYGCSALRTITLPEGVVAIAEGTFAGCTSLATVNLPASLASIGERAFHECASLSAIKLPGALKSIGLEARA